MKPTPTPTRIQAYCFRTAMVGGGTSYDVHFLRTDKPSHPLHGLTYATVICRDGKEFFSVTDAIDPKSHWAMELGWPKYEAFKRIERRAERLAVRIAKRAFPELQPLRKLPTLWAEWSLPSAMVEVPVRLSLPE